MISSHPGHPQERSSIGSEMVGDKVGEEVVRSGEGSCVGESVVGVQVGTGVVGASVCTTGLSVVSVSVGEEDGDKLGVPTQLGWHGAHASTSLATCSQAAISLKLSSEIKKSMRNRHVKPSTSVPRISSVHRSHPQRGSAIPTGLSVGRRIFVGAVVTVGEEVGARLGVPSQLGWHGAHAWISLATCSQASISLKLSSEIRKLIRN